jgi:periplasmic protein TonB
MRPVSIASDSFTLQEVARAAGVAEVHVRSIVGPDVKHLVRADAVRVGRMLVERSSRTNHSLTPRPLFGLFSKRTSARRAAGVPLAVSSTLHAALLVVLVLLASMSVAPHAASMKVDAPIDSMRLVFLNIPGPGGGGGGGGLREAAPPPKAMREGHHTLNSPIPDRRVPAPIAPPQRPPEPPRLESEPLPAVIAPIVVAPADARTRAGLMQETPAVVDSHGPGTGGGIGSGAGSGLGEGNGSGIGPGSGGGTGGGPYRPGSGIEPPRLLKEVKADYTEEARQRGVSGAVVMEIVIRSDGSVGDVKILQGLAGGLNDRATQAVRQWRFAPAKRLGAPVDVIVEVAVEFKLR